MDIKPLDCYLDVVASGLRPCAAIYGVAAVFFDPLGREDVPSYDAHDIAANSPDHGHSMAFFTPITIESNRGFGLEPNVSERMHWGDLVRSELVDDLMGRNCPTPVALDAAFRWLAKFTLSGPGNSRPVRFWMTRPELSYPVLRAAHGRTRAITSPWGDLPDIDSLFTINRLAYGRGREFVGGGVRPHPDRYHPLRACIEGARQVQTAIRDLAEVGPVDMLTRS